MVFQPVRWKTFRRVVWIAWLAMALAACGGGGDKPSPPPSNGSSWGTLIWDQNQWQ